ncbi:MAG TPA: hypothetical protein VGJ59_02255 [Jatrophihabitantaceae bacterium]
MTTTVEQLTGTDTAVEVTIAPDHPQYEAHCTCHRERCPEAATVRVSVECTDQGCTAAACVVLLCEMHADDLEAQTDIVRRPL